MSATVVTGIGELTTNDPDVGVLHDAAVVVEDGTISWLGAAWSVPAADHAIDLGGRAVVPGFVDSHAHLVFDSVAYALLTMTVALTYFHTSRQKIDEAAFARRRSIASVIGAPSAVARRRGSRRSATAGSTPASSRSRRSATSATSTSPAATATLAWPKNERLMISSATAAGISPSPHALSTGTARGSTTATLSPAARAPTAAAIRSV